MTGELTERQQLALDTILQKPCKGIPIWVINPMEWRMIDRLAGCAEGTYEKDPVPTYHRMYENIGVCMVDQWIPTNPLSIKSQGYDDGASHGATTGAEEIVCDGIKIEEPEHVVEHMEKFIFPQLKRAVAEFNEDECVRTIIEGEQKVQEEIGPLMLKTPYGFVRFPGLSYGLYGYVNYFMAYALYPETMEEHFRLQGDYALLHNKAALRAYQEGSLPPYVRLDHDMADSRGTLVDIKSLDRIWFPHFARCLEPLLKSEVRMIWHCDGNLSEMVPRLLEVGLSGFQGFQYEDNMDYEKICGMKTRDGDELLIVAGVSVTKTLPHGTADDVRNEMKWLVEKGPKQGLFLGCSSSMTPGVPWENLQALVEGFEQYRLKGR